MKSLISDIDTFLRSEKGEDISVVNLTVNRAGTNRIAVAVQLIGKDAHVKGFVVKDDAETVNDSIGNLLGTASATPTIMISLNGEEEPEKVPQPQDDLPAEEPGEPSPEEKEAQRKRYLNENWSDARSKFRTKKWEDCLFFLEKASDLAVLDSEKDAIGKMADECKRHLAKVASHSDSDESASRNR